MIQSCVNTESSIVSGRRSSHLATLFRKEIETGRWVAGEYLQPIRKLCLMHEASMETVSRALKTLEAEGWVISEPRKGYRVNARANDPLKGCPLAVILESTEDQRVPLEQKLLNSLHIAAVKRDLPILAVGSNGRNPADMTARLLAAQVWGVVLNTGNTELIDALARAGLSIVLAETWSPGSHVDTVEQDNFHGAFAAATYLINRGHERIGWIGRGARDDSLKAVERHAGAMAALARTGIPLPDHHCVIGNRFDMQALREGTRAMMARPDHPTGLLALWKPMAEAALDGATAAGRVAGRDFEVIGWSIEEEDEGFYPLPGQQGCRQPRMVWSLNRMAEIVLERLDAHRREPNLPAVTVGIPVTLKRGDANAWDQACRDEG